MLADLAASAGGFNIKDVVGPLIGGLMGYMAAIYTSRSNRRAEAARYEISQEADRERRRALNADDLSKRFQVLMDGYECRIKDLTHEVQSLRERVDALVAELNDRRDACSSCPHRLIQVGYDGAA